MTADGPGRRVRRGRPTARRHTAAVSMRVPTRPVTVKLSLLLLCASITNTPEDAMTTIIAAHKEWKRANPLREWRSENGVTIHDASSMFDVSMTTIQLWESGSAQPNDHNMETLTRYIGPNVAKRWNNWIAKKPHPAH